jgi:hypothetical protein
MENMFIGIPKRSWGHSKAAVGGNRPRHRRAERNAASASTAIKQEIDNAS